MSKVIVVGAGAAGMMAAKTAADNGHDVHLYEQNAKAGRKIYITGKGRCNVTNDCDIEDLINNMVHNPKFMYSSFYTYSNEQTKDFFESQGVELKVERGNRVFPVSDKSSDIIGALVNACHRAGVTIHYNKKISKLAHNGKSIMGVYIDKQEIKADAVIIATGGCSYPMTGSSGDGYQFAKQTHHRVTKLEPALVPFNVGEQWLKDLQGLSLKNVNLQIYENNKVKYEAFGEMMFTHFGITGPIVLTASSFINEDLLPLKASIDLKPRLSEKQLDERILKDFKKYNQKDYINSLDDLLPKALIPIIIEKSGIEARKKVDQITKEERQKLVTTLKGLNFKLLSKRSFKEAIITQGGVHVGDINPNTTESKKLKGLYFAGEVLDLDAVTGGFNLQVAFSTGYLAGLSIEHKE